MWTSGANSLIALASSLLIRNIKIKPFKFPIVRTYRKKKVRHIPPIIAGVHRTTKTTYLRWLYYSIFFYKICISRLYGICSFLRIYDLCSTFGAVFLFTSRDMRIKLCHNSAFRTFEIRLPRIHQVLISEIRKVINHQFRSSIDNEIHLDVIAVDLVRERDETGFT